MAQNTTRITKLADFLAAVSHRERLTQKDRLRIVEQALLLLEMNYVHLPLKRAMHAVDPIQQLRLLKFRLSETSNGELSSDMQFHRRMLEIFASTRDLHTMYLLPEPYRNHIAYLPFLIEQHFVTGTDGKPIEKFIVSRVANTSFSRGRDYGLGGDAFECGVEPLFWNGIPMRRAIEINGDSQPGSNLDARFARGLDNLTTRPLDTSLPPDEMWVDLTFRARSGKVFTHRQDWLVLSSESEGLAFSSKDSDERRAAIDVKRMRINEVNQTLYTHSEPRDRKTIDNVLYAEPRDVGGRKIGYVRLFSFDVQDQEQFVKQFVDIITDPSFPQNGLIIDVRGNGGGRIRAGERLLQLFTPREIEPELFEFINTALNLELCRTAPDNWNLKRWVESIAESVATGATYSSGFPLTPPESSNDIGQVYYGPVVLITDALSYSTTDIFAAGFQDNRIGEVLGTSNNTGAGGANVWWYDDLIRASVTTKGSPFKPLPKGADMLVAMRRSLRVGPHMGRPLEELGIAPDERHYMTERDLLLRNEDLLTHASRMLSRKPAYALKVDLDGKGIVTISAKTVRGTKREQISRADIYLDNQPIRTLEGRDGSIKSKSFEVGLKKRRAVLRVEVYDAARRLVAAAKTK